jgi:hypothetical protein
VQSNDLSDNELQFELATPGPPSENEPVRSSAP